MRLSLFQTLFVCLASAITRAETPKVATFFTQPLYPMSDYYDLAPFLDFENGKYHLGEDRNALDGADFGDGVHAPGNGKVVVSRIIETPDPWGKVIVIEHTLVGGRKIYSLVAHLEDVFVSVGEVVDQGELIGTIGDSNGYYGQSRGSGPHLHFEIRNNPNWQISPQGYLSSPLNMTASQQYENPSLFIDDRDSLMVTTLTKNTWKLVKPWRNTSSALAYIEHNGKKWTYAQAVSKGLVENSFQYRWPGEKGWRTLKPSEVNWFGGIEYRVKAKQAGVVLGLVMPGHNFQPERAVQDMIWFATVERLGPCRPETLFEYSEDNVHLVRSMNCGPVAVYHATTKEQPLLRYLSYELDETGEFLDWSDNVLYPSQLDP
ncbi:MAG: M23 family metallopeptidase [Patescibacteria group bacterium]